MFFCTVSVYFFDFLSSIKHEWMRSHVRRLKNTPIPPVLFIVWPVLTARPESLGDEYLFCNCDKVTILYFHSPWELISLLVEVIIFFHNIVDLDDGERWNIVDYTGRGTLGHNKKKTIYIYKDKYLAQFRYYQENTAALIVRNIYSINFFLTLCSREFFKRGDGARWNILSNTHSKVSYLEINSSFSLANHCFENNHDLAIDRLKEIHFIIKVKNYTF